MTVAELIEQLKAYPPETKVLGVGASGYDSEEELDDAWIDDTFDPKSGRVLNRRRKDTPLVIRA